MCGVGLLEALANAKPNTPNTTEQMIDTAIISFIGEGWRSVFRVGLSEKVQAPAVGLW